MKTVFVGLSGGVDSAVSAYLLKQQGYRVVGAFIKGWEPDFLPCTGTEDRLSAMRVAAHLKIPFVTYDLEKEYKQDVVDYFIEEYRAGRTPNPDVICNRAIKFGAFWEKATVDGADMIATGHYAQIVAPSGATSGLGSAAAMFSVSENREAGSRANANGGERTTRDHYALKAGKDAEKDQTYFLWTLTQDDLTHTLFPIGNLEKPRVRALAAEAGLPNAKRPDSQGLCFLGHVDMHAFLKRYIPEQKGAVVDEDGNTVGEHSGVWFYTLGQRHGFVAHDSKPLYVVAKNIDTNTLTVSGNPVGEQAKRTYTLTRVNWLSGAPEDEVRARFRYRQPLIPAEVVKSEVHFKTPELVAPGQSCVFYDRNGALLGGGTIA